MFVLISILVVSEVMYYTSTDLKFNYEVDREPDAESLLQPGGRRLRPGEHRAVSVAEGRPLRSSPTAVAPTAKAAVAAG